MEADQRRDRGGDSGGEVRRPMGDAVPDDQISEDEKIERFFELIRNYKEARDRQRIERERSSAAEDFECVDGSEDVSRKRRKMMKLPDREQSTWIPSFQWEDFTDKAKVEFGCPPVILPASNFDDIGKASSVQAHVKDPPPIPAEADAGGGLDLKLRL